MHRVRRQKDIEPINQALELMPEGIKRMLEGVDILSGVDPGFAGLHFYKKASYNRSYADVAHVTYSIYQRHLPLSDRKTTIVLPKKINFATAIHELGHVLHEKLKFEPKVKPVTWYANTDLHEAFAESFTAWIIPFGYGYGNAKDKLYDIDRRTVNLFEELSQ